MEPLSCLAKPFYNSQPKYLSNIFNCPPPPAVPVYLSESDIGVLNGNEECFLGPLSEKEREWGRTRTTRVCVFINCLSEWNRSFSTRAAFVVQFSKNKKLTPLASAHILHAPNTSQTRVDIVQHQPDEQTPSAT